MKKTSRKILAVLLAALLLAALMPAALADGDMYTVTLVCNDPNATVSITGSGVEGNQAQANTGVFVHADNPPAGKYLKITYSYSDGGNTVTQDITTTGYIFMPEADITVSFEYLDMQTLSVSTQAELEEIAANVNSGTESYFGYNIVLDSDIALTGDWSPIGKLMTTPFRGSFDGGGHTVSGLSITVNEAAVANATSSPCFGLFGMVRGGSVHDLTVSGAINISLPAEYSNPNSFNVGGIAGMVYSGSVSDCVSRVGVTSVNGKQIGGIAGAGYNSSFTDCKNYGSMSLTVTAHNDLELEGVTEDMAGTLGSAFIAGGVVGELSGDGCSVSNCVNYGSFTCSLPRMVYLTQAGELNFICDASIGVVGGIAGSANNVEFSGCANKGSIGDEARVMGGISGQTANDCTLINCYNTGSITNSVDPGSYQSKPRIGGLAGGGYVYQGAIAMPSATAENSYNIGSMTRISGIGYSALGYDTANNAGDVTSITVANLGAAFKDDTYNINSGYPLLAWESENFDNIQNVTITTTPAGAAVKVYSDSALTQEISDYSSLRFGTYFYKATLSGYAAAVGSFNVLFEDVSLNITLKPVSTVTFSVATANAVLTVMDGEISLTPDSVSGGVYVYSLGTGGVYSYTATAPNYNGTTREFTVTGDMEIEVALTPSGQSDSHTKITASDMPFTITSGGTYDLMPGDFAGKTITISTAQPVTLIGSGWSNENISYNLLIDYTVPNADLTLQDVYITHAKVGELTPQGNMIDFTGAGNTLTFAGTSILDKDTNATGYAMIHVPDSAELTVTGGTAYLYKREQGAGIGGNGGASGGEGQTAETNGVIHLEHATIYAKNSKQGALIGAGAQAGTQTPGAITFTNSTLYLIAMSRGGAIGGSAGSNGASSGSTVTVTNSQITVNVDWSGSAIGGGGFDGGNDADGGTLIYESGSIRTFIDENAKGSWGVETAGVHGNKAVTAAVKNAAGKPLYLLPLDVSELEAQIYTVRVDGAQVYRGPLHKYAYINEALPKELQGEVNYTMDNWAALDDETLYVYATGQSHHIEIGSAKYTAIWDGTAKSFTVVPGEQEIVVFTYGDLNSDGKVNSKDVTLLRRHAVGSALLTGEAFTAADLNGDGKVNSKDLTLLRRFIVGMINVFPVE